MEKGTIRKLTDLHESSVEHTHDLIMSEIEKVVLKGQEKTLDREYIDGMLNKYILDLLWDLLHGFVYLCGSEVAEEVVTEDVKAGYHREWIDTIQRVLVKRIEEHRGDGTGMAMILEDERAKLEKVAA